MNFEQDEVGDRQVSSHKEQRRYIQQFRSHKLHLRPMTKAVLVGDGREEYGLKTLNR